MAVQDKLALVKHVAQRAIVQYHDLAQVWLNGAQILDKGAVAESTMLTIISTGEEFALLF